jgi:hypothetical protein
MEAKRKLEYDIQQKLTEFEAITGLKFRGIVLEVHTACACNGKEIAREYVPKLEVEV